jgi:hypothetical protein
MEKGSPLGTQALDLSRSRLLKGGGVGAKLSCRFEVPFSSSNICLFFTNFFFFWVLTICVHFLMILWIAKRLWLLSKPFVNVGIRKFLIIFQMFILPHCFSILSLKPLLKTVLTYTDWTYYIFFNFIMVGKQQYPFNINHTSSFEFGSFNHIMLTLTGICVYKN